MIDADPELAGMEISDDGRHSAQMIGVRMRDHNCVEPIKAATPKIRRDDLLADVEVGVHPLRQAARIDQQCSAVRSNQEDRIALANIESRHLHNTAAKMRM